ncbi:hypothetical protein ADN00_04610 [Ornatilinea apprima]|uniref:DUF429 domain-containing protein n=1 Tax=Ornatilinea apprima TaxID=1134406 RepID=A0A0P6Y2I5_9CHLR|nr:hypothetical protein [Ornatilinea apprima]KPL79142.1 hypothetical protein ADN00_04610 [Ornatilinea apprima]
MEPEEITSIGIEISGGRHPFTFLAVDDTCRLLAQGSGHLEDVLAFCAGQTAARVAVNAPPRPNQQVMAHQETRQSLFPDLSPGRWTQLRLAEYELHQAGISIPRTPSQPEDCPAWMRLGFKLYHHLQELGYQPYPGEAERQWLETQSNAAYWSLMNHAQPFHEKTLEGRLQRQLVLHQISLPVSDPMRFFEELTRHRLLNGILPLESIFSPEELNAWAAVYTAWCSIHHPENLVRFGDPQEGVIYLPFRPQESNTRRAFSDVGY